MKKKTSYWIVWPEDPDLHYRTFLTQWAAQEWADGLCCSYTIEEIIFDPVGSAGVGRRPLL